MTGCDLQHREDASVSSALSGKGKRVQTSWPQKVHSSEFFSMILFINYNRSNTLNCISNHEFVITAIVRCHLFSEVSYEPDVSTDALARTLTTDVKWKVNQCPAELLRKWREREWNDHTTGAFSTHNVSTSKPFLKNGSRERRRRAVHSLQSLNG